MTKQQAMIYVAFMVGMGFGAWFLIFMKWLMRTADSSIPATVGAAGSVAALINCVGDESHCVECGGGPCRVWRKMPEGGTTASNAVCGQKDDGYNAYRISVGIEACGGAAAMGAESSGADAEAALRTPPLSNEHASVILNEIADSNRQVIVSAGTSDIRCKCVGYEAGDRFATDTSPCPIHNQGELLKRFTKPSPNCKSDLPDNDYED